MNIGIHWCPVLFAENPYYLALRSAKAQSRLGRAGGRQQSRVAKPKS